MGESASYAGLYRSWFAAAQSELQDHVAGCDREVVLQWVRENRRLGPVRAAEHVLAWRGSGNTTAEIDHLRLMWEGWLPAAFEGFLALAGAMSSGLDIGVRCFYADVIAAATTFDQWHDEMREASPSWYEPARFTPPPGARPIGNHEGYIFGFLVDRVDDPPILFMHESEGDPFRRDEVPFSERLRQAIGVRLESSMRNLARIADQ